VSEEALPTSYGKYELVERIGEGGMALVYRALQTGPMGFRKEVALKQIRPHVSRVEKMVKALINEARLGGNLHHPNVVEVYDFGEVDGAMYIAMEYIRGHTLHDVLARTTPTAQLPPRIVLRIAEQLCRGLEYAHSAVDVDGQPMNLVHRDLKPSNVIIDANAVVKIMDFGIARADTNLFTTTTGMTKGTPVYMSPEQVRKREDRPIDGRSDLFSLGAVICEMATGRTVFTGTELYEILHKIANAETADAVQRATGRIPQLGPVLERALQENPDDRYPDAGSMREALAACGDQLEGEEELGPWLEAWMAANPAGAAPDPHSPDDPGEAAAVAHGERAAVPATLSASVEPPPAVKRTLAVPSPSRSSEEQPARAEAAPRSAPSASRWPQLVGIAGLLALFLALALVVVVLMSGPRRLGPEDSVGEAVVVDVPTADPVDATPTASGEVPTDASGSAPADPSTDTPGAAPPEDTSPAATAEEPTEEAPAPTLDRHPVILQAKAPDILGGLTAMEVSGPISLQQGMLESCYRPGLLRDPDLSGSLRVNLVIETDGTVAQARISGSSLGDEQVSACFLGVLEDLRFSRPSDGQPAVVEYTFALTSEEGA